jgi:hypothetical protein
MVLTHTHTRTHVFVEFADPYLTCDQCHAWVTAFHDRVRCGPGCEAAAWLVPCMHVAGETSVCPSWGPVDGCQCKRIFGAVSHAEPPAQRER